MQEQPRCKMEESSAMSNLRLRIGAVLRAWFMRPPKPNGDAVILLHGVSDNRIGMYGYGKWLLLNHYMVFTSRRACPRQ